jgi:hypothetical protein
MESGNRWRDPPGEAIERNRAQDEALGIRDQGFLRQVSHKAGRPDWSSLGSRAYNSFSTGGAGTAPVI